MIFICNLEILDSPLEWINNIELVKLFLHSSICPNFTQLLHVSLGVTFIRHVQWTRNANFIPVLVRHPAQR